MRNAECGVRNAECGIAVGGRAGHDTYRYIPHSTFRIPHLISMHRVLIISHTYIPPSNRGKLRALAARGLEVTVGVPQRWRDLVLGRTLEIAWERQNGVEVFPLPARHSGDAATLTFRGRALHALLRDKRDRKSTRLNSSHSQISYAVFCL